MKLSTEAIIAPAKLTRYLLIWKPENDKSQWLAKAGYTIENWQQLATDLREQVLSHYLYRNNPFRLLIPN